MSRTRKDAPYWVRVNRTATSTNHDHLSVGKKVYYSRAVKDENGNVIYDETVIGLPALELAKHVCPSGFDPDSYLHSHIYLLHKAGVSYYDCRDFSIPRAIFQRARELCANGLSNEFIPLGTYQKRRTERYFDHEYKDYCTEGEPDVAYKRESKLRNPCTPDWPYTMGPVMGMSEKKHSYSRVHYGHERVSSRDILKNAAKGYNTGEDIEEFEDDIHSLTSQHRHSMKWDLW